MSAAFGFMWGGIMSMIWGASLVVNVIIGFIAGLAIGLVAIWKKPGLFAPTVKSLSHGDAILKKREQMLKSNKSNEAEPDEAQRDLLRSTQFLFKEYKPQCWWFELFECFRRLGLTGGTVFIKEGSRTQIAFGIFVSVICIYVHASTKP